MANTICSLLHVESKKIKKGKRKETKLMGTKTRFVVARGEGWKVGKMGEGG